MGYREGDGAAAAGGEHRDAGPPPAAMGREAGHQEGGKGKAGPRVPAEHILVGHPRAARPGGAGEDRPDRVEPEALQGLRLGRIVFTPSAVPTRARSAIPRNRPCSTTTGIEEIAAAATIFSRNKAPPIPLIRFSAGSTSSAPSIARSSSGCSSRDVRGIPRSFAASAVAREAGTPRRAVPPATSRG